jgi:hypothetical protein
MSRRPSRRRQAPVVRPIPADESRGPENAEDYPRWQAQELVRLNAVLQQLRPTFPSLARDLLEHGTCAIPSPSGTIDVRLRRFWTGARVMDARQARPSRTAATFGLVDPRAMRVDPVACLARDLRSVVSNLEHGRGGDESLVPARPITRPPTLTMGAEAEPEF